MKKAKKSHKKPLLVAGVIVLLIGVMAALYFVIQKDPAPANGQKTERDMIDYNPPTDEQKQAAETEKLNKNNTPSNPQPNNTTPTIAITSAEQDADRQLVVKTELAGSGWNKCTLMLKHNNQTITKEADVLYQPSFSTCMGFAVGASELADGEWNLTLTASKTDGTTATATKTTNVHL